MNTDNYDTGDTENAGYTSGYTSGTETCNLEFGARLRELREKRGLSRNELGERLGVAMSSIQRYEEGSFPKGDVIIKLCEELNTSADWLLFGNRFTERAASVFFNEDLFSEVAEQTEKFLSKRKITLEASRKIKIILLIYKASISTGRVDISVLDTLFHGYKLIMEDDRVTKKQTINGSGNTQVGGNFVQNIHGKPKVEVSVLPPDDSIGGDSMLRDRIQSLIDELGMRRKERFGDKAFPVMIKNFKKDLKIPSNKKWTCIWLWKKSRANEVIQYLEGKLKNTIQGRIENAAARPGYRQSRGHLFGRISKRMDELGLTSDSPEVRGWMKDYFGVTSRKDMNDEQLANWLAFLETKVDQL